MALTMTVDALRDDLAISLACALAAANQKAREIGLELADCLVTVTQETAEDDSLWRVHYGPKAYIGRRGGDLVIEINGSDASIKRVLRGQ